MSSITIQSFSPPITWPYGGSTATLRITYSANFLDSTSQAVIRGLYRTVDCTISAGVLLVPVVPLITTNDALVNPLVTCSAQFFDSRGAARDWLFQGFQLPQLLAPSCSIGALFTYNQGSALPGSNTEFFLDRDETVALITAMLDAAGILPATELALGIVRLRTAAVDASDPEVYGTNDPQARDALTIQGVVIDDTPPADENVLRYSALDGFAQWAANTVRGITPNTRTISAVDSAVATDDVLFLDPTSASFNLTFMLASTRSTPLTVKNIATNANAVNLVAAGADTIDGSSPLVLPAGVSMTFFPRTTTAWESI